MNWKLQSCVLHRDVARTHARMPQSTAHNYIVTPRVFNLSGAPPPPPPLSLSTSAPRGRASSRGSDFAVKLPYNPVVLTPAETVFSRFLHPSPHETAR